LTSGISAHGFGGLLREWRRRRRMTQFDLACKAGVSTNHLSLLESGRSEPSLTMVLQLANCLDVPLRERNVLLSAAGLVPIHPERDFFAPSLDVVRRNIEVVLAAHDPNPALVIDRHWTMLAANPAVAHLVAGAERMLLRPPVNVLRLLLHPAGLASRIVNLAQWRTHAVSRLRQQTRADDDTTLLDLLEEILDYPCPRDSTQSDEAEGALVMVPLRLATIDGVLSFFVTTTRFDAPVDITVADLRIEAFHPADVETAEIMRRVAHQAEKTPAAAALVLV
jgi:transcriptional regulator with XRE-family HTH domain